MKTYRIYFDGTNILGTVNRPSNEDGQLVFISDNKDEYKETLVKFKKQLKDEEERQRLTKMNFFILMTLRMMLTIVALNPIVVIPLALTENRGDLIIMSIVLGVIGVVMLNLTLDKSDE